MSLSHRPRIRAVLRKARPECRGASPLAVLAAAALFALSARPAAAAPLVAYDDALRNGFEDWSWAVHDLAQTSTVHAGTVAASFEPDAWAALFFHKNGGIDPAAYDTVDFFIHGGPAGGQNLVFAFVLGGSPVLTIPLAPYVAGGVVPAGAWAAVHLSLDALAVTNPFDGVFLQDAGGGNQSAVFVDDLSFGERALPVGPVAVSVDPSAERRPISPLVYGVNRPDAVTAANVPYPLQRWGGNGTTRYSWEDDVSNHANDWFFVNYAKDTNVAALPNDSTADRFASQARASGAEVLMTVPTIGWTPVDRVRRWGFSVTKYGPQQSNECTDPANAQWCDPDYGNGRYPNGSPITGNFPSDTSRPVGVDFATRWVDHLVTRLGNGAAGGVRYYGLDNEPMLWNDTHRDVHPLPVDYAELWQMTLTYGAAIKQHDPTALVLGPDSWGWCDYFWSAKDGCGNNGGSDYLQNGPLLEWYLSRVEQHRIATGVRLVDVLDIHYYPQGDNVALDDDESAATAALRLRSTRSLWDPAYLDESWISSTVRLVPRMKELIAAEAPGTKLAITEWSWGGDDGLSSALAHAEALALFGREGVDMAARWIAPAAGTRVEDAFRLFLDYDGAGANAFGDSIRATSSDPNGISSYAILGTNGKLFVLLINKGTTARTADVAFLGGLPASASIALHGFDPVNRLAALGSVAPTAAGFSLPMPGRSLRFAVVTGACATPDEVDALRIAKGAAGALSLSWASTAGSVSYQVREDVSPSGAFASTVATTSGTSLPLAGGEATTRYFRIVSRNGC